MLGDNLKVQNAFQSTLSHTSEDDSLSSIISSNSQEQILDWFRMVLCEVGDQEEMVSITALKKAIEDHKDFDEYLFSLFDTSNSRIVSMQDLVGGLGMLTRGRKKSKLLHWFEQIFEHVSRKDQLLELNEFKKALRMDGFLEHLYQLMDSDSNGILTVSKILDAFKKLRCKNHDAKWLAWFKHQFFILARSDGQIDLDDFKQAFDLKESFFAKRFFDLFDSDHSGFISLPELMDALILLNSGSDEEKLHFLFKVYDVDGNGYIDFSELKTVLRFCMDESKLQFSDDSLDELTRALFESTDVDNSGTITFDELKEELNRHPGVVKDLTISAANWLKPTPPRPKRNCTHFIPHWVSLKYIQNNLTLVVWMILYFWVNVGLFLQAAVEHSSGGVQVAIARGCGQCLNFNPTIIIMLVMRRGLTWLRSTRVYFLFPFDHYIELHKMCGWTIALFSIGHVISHIANYILLSRTPDGLQLWKYFFSVHTGFGWVGGAAGLTGTFLVILLGIMVSCALPCVRKKGYFEVFYWTHNLFVVWYIFLLLHASNFWKWFIVPGILYIIERISRAKWVKRATFGRTYIQEGILLPSKVTHLVLTRPTNFTYKPGDYIFLQIPAIAKYEWHPFTISSAPEQQGFIWIHIRSVGTWTKRLYDFFDKRNKPNAKKIKERHRTKELHQSTVDNIEVANNRDLTRRKSERYIFSAISLPKQQQAVANTWKKKLSNIFDIKRKHCKVQDEQISKEEEHQHRAHRSTMVTLNDLSMEIDYLHESNSVTLVREVNPIPPTEQNENEKIAKSKKEDRIEEKRIKPSTLNVQVEDMRVEVHIDGPYSSTATRIFQAEHAVLIGAGIGITPFASILQSVVMRYHQTRQVCPSCNHTWTESIPASVMRLKKVDFFWINRDQRCFEWFVTLLSELEIEQNRECIFEKFLELHLYMTAALGKTDIKAIGLQMALDLIHKKEKRDLITGLQTRTQAGRPDWDKVFTQLETDAKGKISVFFCGPPAISNVLKAKCSRHGFGFRKENF